jgi:exoribonuclease-2
LGKSAKSKTMKDLGLSETPEDAHALLLKTGFWTVMRNPHPARFNVLQDSAKAAIKAPPHEERRDLTRLVSLAIDNAWTNDPDDAISTEEAEGARILYVHVADIASSVSAEDLSEREARDRGVTLYIPEGNVWMLAEESVQLFGLGIRETSPALTFKMVLDELGEIIDTEIFPSWIKARRLSYQEADQLLDSVSGSAPAAPDADAGIAAILSGLNTLAERNMRRRGIAGAVNIELPETRIHLDQDIVRIEPIPPYRSSGIVRECMLLAGEAAARWAISRFTADAAQSLAFPFVCQEPGDLPADVLPDPAGSYQLRRCMRPRTVSIKPSPHWGLGLDAYTQVTSPLRRYTDLLAHIQLRAILRGEKPLPAEDVSARLAAAEAAAQAAAQAERASRGHRTMVYLSDKKDSLWDAIALEKKMNRWALVIPALALETQVSLRRDVRPNDPVKLVLKSVNIPRCEVVFAEA